MLQICIEGFRKKIKRFFVGSKVTSIVILLRIFYNRLNHLILSISLINVIYITFKTLQKNYICYQGKVRKMHFMYIENQTHIGDT